MSVREVSMDAKAWETAVSLERRKNGEPELVVTSNHIILGDQWEH